MNALASGQPEINAAAFAGFRCMLQHSAGIHLAENKQTLVASRLMRRLRQLGLDDFSEYHALALRSEDEQQLVIDLLTTNETRFFREPAHFDRLRDRILPQLPHNRLLRFWSAAASSGEEAYSIAMTLARHAPGRRWEVFGSDISRRVVQQAQSARYPMRQATELPADFFRDYCQPCLGDRADSFAIAPAISNRVRFSRLNLNARLPDIGMFDVILLRNVLIYFEGKVRRQIVERVRERLLPGGWLLTGHSESLGELAHDMTQIAPSIYRA